MRVPWLLLGPAVLAGCAAAGRAPVAPPTPAPILRRGAVTEQLPGGLKVIVQEGRATPVVALQIWVKVGAGDDPADTPGMANLLENLVFQSIYGSDEGKKVRAAGGRIRSWTTHEFTVFQLVVPSRRFDQALTALAAAVSRPAVGARDLMRARVRVGRKLGPVSPLRRATRNLFAAAFAQGRYDKPLAAVPDQLGGDTVRRFFARWYNPQNMSLTVVGDVTSRSALRRIRAAFNLRTATRPLPALPPARFKRYKGPILFDKSTCGQAAFALGFRVPALTDPAAPGLDLAALVLNARLSQRAPVGQTRSAFVHATAHPGLLVVRGTAPAAVVERALAEALTEALSLGQLSPTVAELRLAKVAALRDAASRRETVEGQARALGFSLAVADHRGFGRQHERRLQRTSAAEVKRQSGRFLRADNLTLALVGPAAGKVDAVRSRLARRVARVAAKAGGNRAARRQVEGRVVKVTLDNGARLLVLADATVPLVAFEAVWPGGAAVENEANNGVSRVWADVVSRGSRRRSAEAVEHDLALMAGQLSGFAGRDTMGIRLQGVSSGWRRGLELLAEVALQPTLAEPAMERARQRLLDQVRLTASRPERLASRLFRRAVYGKGSLVLDTEGTTTSLVNLTRRDLVGLHRALRPGCMVLAVVGDVDADKLAATFGRLFGAGSRCPAPQTASLRPTAESAGGSRHVSAHHVSSVAQLVLGYPGLTSRDPDRFSLQVLTALLRRRLARGAGLSVAPSGWPPRIEQLESARAGHLAFQLSVTPQGIPTALSSLRRLVSAVRTRPATAAELERAKRRLVGRFEMSLRRRAAMARQLAGAEVVGQGFGAWRGYKAAIAAVTAADLLRVARRVLDPRREVVAVVRPEELSAGAGAALDGEREPGRVNPDAPARKKRRRSARKRRRKR